MARRAASASRSRSLARCGRDGRYAERAPEPSRSRQYRPDREPEWDRADDRRGSYRDDRDTYRGQDSARGRRDCSRSRDAAYGRYPSRERNDVSRDDGRWRSSNGGQSRSWGHGGVAGDRDGSGRYGSRAGSTGGEGRYGSPRRSRSHGDRGGNPPWRRRDPSPPPRRDRDEYCPPDRSGYRDRSPRGGPGDRPRREERVSPMRHKDRSPSPPMPARPASKDGTGPEHQEQAKDAEGDSGKAYFGASVVDGVPRADKRPTWRAEIYLPRPGAPLAHRDRGSVCIRGPNRFSMEEAEDDLAQCKWTAEQSGDDAAKQVRALASRLKTDFERQKHVDSGHAHKE